MIDLQRLARIENEVSIVAASSNRGLMLFGSVARGDDTDESDIDILQLVSTNLGPRTTCGNFVFSNYATQQLRRMFCSGNLFALHLLHDGVILSDPYGELQDCLDSYTPPNGYTKVLEELGWTAKFLAVDCDTFEMYSTNLVALGIYILRTKLFVDCAKSGRPSFSVPDISRRFADPRIQVVYNLGKKSSVSFLEFEELKAVIEKYLAVKIQNEFGSFNDLIQMTPVNYALARKLAWRTRRSSPLAAYE